MDVVVIVIALVIVTFFLAKPRKSQRKSKKFGEGLFGDGPNNFAPYDWYF